ncbi:programmed cell death protein 4-like isoform X4 [Stegostoma tigrinum]|uniref:programmed cell death protein 4-like isoform X4 n=1 Tax=Stegostoma tigrinum TaxID=3053191 RepID=UPI00202B741B|nr:programmed cell death protein 4-like isoform X4 [Stegostoma tigrinum]
MASKGKQHLAAADCIQTEDGNDAARSGTLMSREEELHEACFTAKAKRKLRKNSSRDSDSSHESFSDNVEAPGIKGKTGDKKSRSGKGRGLPKKGGAGGKGVWGAAVQVYDVEQPDVHDPNYDDDKQGETVYQTVVPELDDCEFEKAVTPIIQEYFQHGHKKEVAMLGQFIARAMADHVLPTGFLDSYKGKVDCEQARVALDKAVVLLSMNRGVRLDNVWGVGGGLRPVKQLVKEMTLLLKEYLLSTDSAEAGLCLQNLEVPHFHHELVYEAVVMVLESTSSNVSDLIVKLLKSFWESGFVTLDQMNRGFKRVFNAMPDISLDAPNSYSILKSFVDHCHQQGVITKALQDQCPTREAKPAVSEDRSNCVVQVDQ